jgi:hypothetical protein
MRFRTLADRLGGIEEATSRRAIVHAVADLLRAADARSLEAVARQSLP